MSESNDAFEKLFNPKSIAIVGVSGSSFQFGGLSFLGRLQEAGYPGRLYPINPKIEERSGLKFYPNLTSLPEKPDLVIVCITAKHVPAVLEECGQIGIENIHILTSGFKGIGTKEGIELESQVKSAAEKYRLNVVGPNCMGVYSPTAGLTAWGAIPGRKGNVGVISQSGGITQRLTEYLDTMGIGISKAVSVGNSTVLDVCDFLEFMQNDPITKLIAVYLEDVEDGRRLFQLAKPEQAAYHPEGRRLGGRCPDDCLSHRRTGKR